MNHIQASLVYKILAQAYGESNYSTSVYGGEIRQNEAGTETTQDSPLAPLTGLVQEQPPSVIIPAILLISVILGSISFLVTRAIRSRKNKS